MPHPCEEEYLSLQSLVKGMFESSSVRDIKIAKGG